MMRAVAAIAYSYLMRCVTVTRGAIATVEMAVLRVLCGPSHDLAGSDRAALEALCVMVRFCVLMDE